MRRYGVTDSGSVHWHDYTKSEYVGRKVAHIAVIANNETALEVRCQYVEFLLVNDI
ncbi:MAG: hypothetical protein P8X74_07735 [Reinekea sp.]